MNAIGGYFELELPYGEEYHKDAIRLNTARNAFEYILRAKEYKKVYLPYYTCDVMLEPLLKLKIEYQFYSIDNEFRPIFNFCNIEEDSGFVYTNYFGLCDHIVEELNVNCKNLIIDNSQAFYSLPPSGIDTFYSARKFFGVPDGAYLYTDTLLNESIKIDISWQRFEHLLGRIDKSPEEFYPIFKKNDESLSHQPIKQMSKLTQRLLGGINYQEIAEIRRMNFNILHTKLHINNQLILNFSSSTIPMLYPYLVSNGEHLKKTLIQNKIFVPTYWPNVCKWNNNDWELFLMKNLVCIPIDQRYFEPEMLKIIEISSHHA